MNNTKWISFSSKFSNPNIYAYFSKKNFLKLKNNSRNDFANLVGLKGKLITPKQIHSNKLCFSQFEGDENNWMVHLQIIKI